MAAPASGEYKSVTASKQSHAAADRTRFCLFFFTRTQCHLMILHLDALAIPWVDKNNRAFG